MDSNPENQFDFWLGESLERLALADGHQLAIDHRHGSQRFFELQPAEHVLRVLINRPERLNALTSAAHTELTEV